jgi:hypothetical protein
MSVRPARSHLSFAGPGGRLPEDAVVVIQDPQLDGDALTYAIKVLDGTVPAATGHARCSSTHWGVPCHRSPWPG